METTSERNHSGSFFSKARKRGRLLFFAFPFLSCAFGSLGNSANEKSEELQALYRISDERRTSIFPWIYYSDDQGDSDLASFTLGGNTSYQVEMIGNSVVLENISFLFSPKDSIFPFAASASSNKVHAMHSGGSSGSGPEGSGSYAIRYGIQGNFAAGDIGVSDHTASSGPVHAQNLSPFPDVPYGTLAHIYAKYSRIFLDFRIVRQSDSETRILHLELRNAELQIEPACNLEIPYTKPIPFSIGFRTDGLLSSRAGSSFSLLDALFALPASEITVNDSQNPDLYSETLANVSEPGQVLVFYPCL